MAAYLANRLAQAVLVVFVVSVLAFLLADSVGDPVASILGLEASAADREALRARLHLDDPIVIRYARSLAEPLRGNLGTSYTAQRPVSELLAERIPASVELAGAALILSLSIGVPIGLYGAVRRGRIDAGLLMGFSIIGVSLPSFFLGILLILGFSLGLGLLPPFGRGEVISLGHWSTGLLTASGLKSLIMPALSLALGQVALVARLTRAEMLDVLRTDYIRFARARGLTSRAIHLGHALRNTWIPIITVSGIQLGYLLAFAVVIEQVFQWPGMGLLFLQALEQSDMPVITAFLLAATLAFVGINLAVDLLYVAVDPRIRQSAKAS